jgi:hypothetical protein
MLTESDELMNSELKFEEYFELRLLLLLVPLRTFQRNSSRLELLNSENLEELYWISERAEVTSYTKETFLAVLLK